MKARIALALGASLALHAAALSYVFYKGLDRAQGLPAASALPGGVMMARLVVDDKPLPTSAAVQSATAAVEAVQLVPASAPVSTAGLALSLPRPAASAAVSAFAGNQALAGFVPATQLTVKPVPVFVGELEPDWLSEIKGAAVATVSVYVAADGSVFHVEVRKASNPRIAELVRAAFAQARFKPGVMQGQNVAARVDISLDYENQRDRVANPDAARPAERVLSAQDARQGAQIAPDTPQQGMRYNNR